MMTAHLPGTERSIVGIDLHPAPAWPDEALILGACGRYPAGACVFIAGNIGVFAEPPGSHPLERHPGCALRRCHR